MIEDSIVRQILDAWLQRVYPNLPQRQLPNFHDAKEVFEKVFLASLKQEEGRPVRFSVVLASPSDIDDPSHRYNKDFRRFATPLPFTAESIAKLAPAFDPLLSSISVCRDPATRNLQCWGIFNYSPIPRSFSGSSADPIWVTCFPPDLLTLRVKNPGSIQVSRLNSNIGWFIDGQFVLAAPTPFTSRSLGKYLIQSLESTDLWQRYGASYWGCYRAALEVLLSESTLRGHGSIIALLVGRNTAIPEQLVSDAYCLEVSIPLRTHLENRLEANGLNNSSGNSIRDYLQRLAQLSTVDGALILTRELELVAFGAKLKAPKWAGKVLEGMDGSGYVGGSQFDAQRYGTRHNAVINFAAECEGSIVFVISQDGPVRAFTKSDQDTVLYWPDCTISVFV